jgi:hypothetical protein
MSDLLSFFPDSTMLSRSTYITPPVWIVELEIGQLCDPQRDRLSRYYPLALGQGWIEAE